MKRVFRWGIRRKEPLAYRPTRDWQASNSNPIPIHRIPVRLAQPRPTLENAAQECHWATPFTM